MKSYRLREWLVILEKSGPVLFAIESISVERVGVKAFGLSRVPKDWVPDFFCVSAGCFPSQASLNLAGSMIGMAPTDPVLVRSSGTQEGIDERGTLHSEATTLGEAASTLRSLRRLPAIADASKSQNVHFIVQRRVRTVAKGHLSNERRVSQKARDWRAEIEPSPGQIAGCGSVAVRRWRDGIDLSPALPCELRANIYRTLRYVAAWAGDRRLHWEWVWDGGRIWIVQCEPADGGSGIKPSSLVKESPLAPDLSNDQLNHFKIAGEDDFVKYRKLANARLYRELGYSLPKFYVCQDRDLLASIQSGQGVPDSLLSDLQLLCKSPFVIRTDGEDIPEERRQMLPRSDELRDEMAAKKWLEEVFLEKLNGIDVAEVNAALIGHHFVPAISSAWARSYPGARRVRIESLWGIPEGLYYFPHDVFEVDVAKVSSNKNEVAGANIILERFRFKSKFIAPNAAGQWDIHQVARPHDWAPSISSQDWVKEIAQTTRRIADYAGHPVVVMWFIGLKDGRDAVIPWYHEEWRAQESSEVSSLGKISKSFKIFTITCEDDLQSLRNDEQVHLGVSRVAVVPKDSAIVRDTKFIDRLADVVKERGYSVELRGGMLSHVYYTLQRAGCDVLCVDEVGTDDETFEFNKLVRDNIPATIESKGEAVELVRLKGDALLHALKEKLVEEALEVVDASDSDSIVEELADLLEVVEGVESVLGIDRATVERVRRRKRDARGGFSQGLMLLQTRLTALPEEGLESKVEDLPIISSVRQIPKHDSVVNIDKRKVGVGAERIIRWSMPVSSPEFSLVRPVFDLETPIGQSHPMRLEATATRSGGELRLKLVLSNAPYQLNLFGDGEGASANDEGKGG